jgi:hypothetical protein
MDWRLAMRQLRRCRGEEQQTTKHRDLVESLPPPI